MISTDPYRTREQSIASVYAVINEGSELADVAYLIIRAAVKCKYITPLRRKITHIRVFVTLDRRAARTCRVS